jgi:NADPH-dependent ferric siderophore reductase
VLHGDGPASTWAEQAAPGQQLGIGGPRGSFVVPTGFDWHVLIGDETALPAIARRLEELPAAAQALVLIEVPAESNEIPLATRAQASVRWLHRNGTAPGHSILLLDAARELRLPPGEGYVWVAAESAVAKALREIMVGRHGIDKSRIRAASYWKRGAAAVHESHEG